MAMTAEISDLTDDGLPLKETPRFVFVSGLDKSYSASKRRFVLLRHFAKQQKVNRTDEEWRITATKSRAIAKRMVSPSPPLILNAAALDPFQTLPLQVDNRQGALISHFANMKSLFYRHIKGKLDPFRRVLDSFAIKSELVITCVLALSANHLAMLRRDTASPEAIRYESRAMAMLRNHLTTIKGDQDFQSVVVSTQVLDWIWRHREKVDVLNKSKPNNEYTNHHVRGLRQLLMSRGGIVDSPLEGWQLTATLLGADLESWGELTVGLTPLSVHSLSMPYCACCGAEVFDRNAIPVTVREFLGVYANLYQYDVLRRQKYLSSGSGFGSQNSVHSSLNQDYIYKNFQSDSILHRFLVIPQRPYSIGAILWFTLFLYDSRNNSSEIMSSYFTKLNSHLIREGVDADNGSLPTILWIASTDESNNIICKPRIWLVTRLLWVIHQLNEELLTKLESNLLWFLSLPVGPGVKEEDLDWDPASFAKDVLTDLGLHAPFGI